MLRVREARRTGARTAGSAAPATFPRAVSSVDAHHFTPTTCLRVRTDLAVPPPGPASVVLVDRLAIQTPACARRWRCAGSRAGKTTS